MLVANVFKTVMGVRHTDADDWITVREAAELTGFNVDYVRLLVRRNKLRYFKKEDRKLWVSKKEVLDYAEKYKNPPEGYITVAEACAITGYSQPTLSRLAREKLVKSEICRGKTYVDRRDVVEYARQHGRRIAVEAD